MDYASSKIEEGLQADCKNQPLVHGQLAGISKLNPRRLGTRFCKSEVRSNLAIAERAGSAASPWFTVNWPALASSILEDSGPVFIAACLAGAAIVQLVDVQPLREQIMASIAERSDVTQLDPGQVARLVLEARSIDVVPSFQCSNREQEYRANVQLMLATARANIPINSVYLARYNYGVTWRDLLRRPSREILWARRDDYCEQEFKQARRGGGPGDVFVLLSDRPRLDEMGPGVTCSPLSWVRYCRRSDPRESRIR
jgi:hypothetical protein